MSHQIYAFSCTIHPYPAYVVIPFQHQPHQTMQFLDPHQIMQLLQLLGAQSIPYVVILCPLCQYQVYQVHESLGSFDTQSDFEYQNVASNPNNYENQGIINMSFSQPVLNDNNYAELNSGLQNKRKDTRKVNFKLFCLPHGDLTSKIPRIVAKLHASLKKSACFDNDLDDDGIKKAVEELFPCLKGNTWRFFRCKSTSDLEVAPEPINGWSISELKHIANSRKKLYLGIIN